MSYLDELQAEYDERYGEGWDRQRDLTEYEEIAWIEACYDYYENECEKKDVYGGPYTDKAEEWYGFPFEIVDRISVNDTGYDLIALPMWKIRIDADGFDEVPGIFAAYPEELFVVPREKQWQNGTIGH